MLAPWMKSYDQTRQYIKKQRHYFANKGPSSQGYRFSSCHVWMWDLDYKESWALKNQCFWTVVLDKTLASLLDCKEIQPVHPKGDQSWLFIGRTDVGAETPILWPPDAKSWLIWKDADAGKYWRQEEMGITEDETVGWHQDSMEMNLSRLQGLVMNREAWRAAVHGVTKSWTRPSDWTELNVSPPFETLQSLLSISLRVKIKSLTMTYKSLHISARTGLPCHLSLPQPLLTSLSPPL